MWTGPWIGWGQAKRSWRGRIQKREKGRTGSLAPPPLRFMPFLLSSPALLETRELFDCKKAKQNKKQLPRAFCKHWSLVLIHTLATVNIPLPSVLVKGVSALRSIELLLISYPNHLFVRRLGYGRCPFRLTVVELGTKLFIKRAQRALLQCLTVLWNDNPYLDWKSKGIYPSICLSFHSWLETTDMEFLDELTEGLDRVLMVRGGGREVITIYSWRHLNLPWFEKVTMGEIVFVAYVYVYKEVEGSKVIYFCLSLPA